jgi:tetratricopeptide (TPR) repeat protein
MIFDPQDSIELMRKAVSESDFERIRCEIEPSIVMSKDASLLGQLSLIFRERELWQDSETVLSKAIQMYPSLPSLHAQMALLFIHRDDIEPKDSYDRSREELEIAINLEDADNEPSPSTHTLLGKTYEFLKDYEKAGGEYQRALEIDPHCSEARYNLAIVMRDFIRPSPKEQVRALLMECAHEDPENFLILRDLGWQLLVFGQLDEAESYLQKALLLHEDDVSLHAYLGQLKWTQKDPVAAEMHFQRAVTIDPSIAMSHRLLGRFYRFHDRIDDANRELFSAIELDPADLNSVRAYRAFLEELDEPGLAARIYSSVKLNSILPMSTLQGLDHSLWPGPV